MIRFGADIGVMVDSKDDGSDITIRMCVWEHDGRLVFGMELAPDLCDKIAHDLRAAAEVVRRAEGWSSN